MTSRGRLSIPLSRALSRWPVVKAVSNTVAHLVGSPSLDALYLHSALMTMSPEQVVEAVLGERIDCAQEYALVRDRLASTSPEARRYPDFYDVEDGTAFLLYMLVRGAKPGLVVEVGVADGRSTQVILAALDANGAGRLISVDIADDVAAAAVGHPRWELRVHSTERSTSDQLRQLFAEVGSPDLFLHDAMHTYYDQYSEYLAAWDHVQAGSLFLSDDVDQSWAFVHFVKGVGLKPVVLTDRRKAVGVFRR